ncbi:MAG: Signal peptidase I [candidate division WWE3 bacterium GW2011_GWF2_41_45]|uniref:Signal peptidase I n=3 Tax=Katanobacteria TaxID=422282 RepID=A0A1F4W3F7_UNCKA|nr:MAG: Signal peptidase I [candidate division WWE3 bacterium GW2011_GWC2_41_23]KKS10742.1 MAG: Signal peptidase I [candidate division WWE3 bacterium GW2011_GWF2_41_45]KKS12419.1 MAG: Signal peptidase I [candidate division WWE3 bacterium GW2011_GWF1_41_53]KKS20202.1 MAG: Signal peptidase I [candidate division WWE3 bacterium GW2011_GWE1_41_72]KKS28151.1 MAG: Signal peptidase I [candidate division WWE3 bacterium GW2011_GWC1_42_102]KKS29581.1 MAG: Signal peptidase I [candidate division WWE3 bacte
MNIKRHFYEITESFLTSLVVVLILYITIGSVEVVWGASMEPNFETGERILVDKISKNFRDYERGEVVVLVPPTEDSKHFIKRVIGLPGDIIKVFECKIYIYRDGKQFTLDEEYLGSNGCTVGGSQFLLEGRSVEVEAGHYVVMGDNRRNSLDSRVFGMVEASDIVGRVVFRFWPIGKAGFVN